MKIKSVFALFFIALLFLFSCGSGSKENKSIPLTSEGNYKKHCVACHGTDGNMGAAGAKKLPESGMSPQERENIISTGKGNMPSFKNKLGSEEIKALAEYTLTLK